MLTLEGIRYSPWTEKARWALDHHEIAYHYREHLIMAGMPGLRWRMRRLWGEITVPVLLLGGGKWVMDSLEIARWAEKSGASTQLLPSHLESEILKWNELTEDSTDAARALVLYKMARDPEAQRTSLPRFVPNALRGPMSFVSRMGMKYISKSFGSAEKKEEEQRARLALFATKLQTALSRDYLVGGAFSFADVAAASSLAALKPVGDKFLKLPEPIRRVWTEPELAEKFPDLLEWRDRIYAKHRKRRLSPTG